jgi:hypothetical protein
MKETTTTRAAWAARGGEPVRAVLDLDTTTSERTLGEHLGARCEACGATGVDTFATEDGRRCALDVGL